MFAPDTSDVLIRYNSPSPPPSFSHDISTPLDACYSVVADNTMSPSVKIEPASVKIKLEPYPAGCSLDSEDSAKKRKQDRNRISAANSRLRKKEHSDKLEKQVGFLIEQNAKLASDRDALQRSVQERDHMILHLQQQLTETQSKLASETNRVELSSREAEMVLQHVHDVLMESEDSDLKSASSHVSDAEVAEAVEVKEMVKEMEMEMVDVEGELDFEELTQLLDQQDKHGLPNLVADGAATEDTYSAPIPAKLEADCTAVVPQAVPATGDEQAHLHLVMVQLRAVLTGIAFAKLWADSDHAKLLAVSSNINSADCPQLKTFMQNFGLQDPKAMELLLQFASMLYHAHPSWECAIQMYQGCSEMKKNIEMETNALLPKDTVPGIHAQNSATNICCF